MLETITRKTGNSIAITIPSELMPHVNESYIIAKTSNGGFVLVPKINNPLDDLPDDFNMEDVFAESAPQGREIF